MARALPDHDDDVVLLQILDTSSRLVLEDDDIAHIGMAGDAPGMLVSEVDGVVPRSDGNTVQMDRELLTMGRAPGDFSAAQTALAAKFRLVRYAIKESY